jgi:hypothetical protein
LQFELANANPKIAKEYVFANADRRPKKNTERTTSCIVHLADSANYKVVTFNKLCTGLTGLCFEMPNDTIHVTVTSKPKKTRPELY